MDDQLATLERVCQADPSNLESTARLARFCERSGQQYSGPVLQEALTALRGRNRFHRKRVMSRLVSLGSLAIPSLEESLRDERWPVRQKAAEILRLMGKSARSSLRKMLEHNDLRVRKEAIKAFSEWQECEVIPEIIRSMNRGSLPFQRFALTCLLDLDPKILHTYAVRLRRASAEEAVVILELLQGFGESALPYLLEGLRSDDVVTVSLTRQCFTKYGERALGVLTAALNHEDGRIRRGSLVTLGNLVPISSKALAIIREATHNEHWEVRVEAFHISSRCFSMRPKEMSLSIFQNGLRDKHIAVRQAACQGLLGMGEWVLCLWREIIDNWSSIDRTTRIALAQMYFDYGAEEGELVTLWLHLLEDAEVLVRMKALHGLGSLGAQAASALPRLKSLEKQSRGAFKAWIRRACRRIERSLPKTVAA